MKVASKNIAVVSANGLGDGLIALVLSHNLQLNGAKVTTYNNPLCQLKNWFPTHELSHPPHFDTVNMLLQKHDHIFALDHSVASALHSDNLTILKESSLRRDLTWIENIEKYCNDTLKLKNITAENGIEPPSFVTYKRYPNRIAIHPTSTELKRDWLPEKFVDLIYKMKKHGFDPILCVGPMENDYWKEILPLDIQCPPFKTLEETAAFIYESGYLVGVNSGLGHLASNLGIPTLSLFARMSYAKLWRPGWPHNQVVTPPPLLIGSNLKHRYWKKCLTVGRVFKNFKAHYSTSQLKESEERNSPHEIAPYRR